MLSRHVFASLMLSAAIVSLTVESTVAQTLYGSAGSLQNRENAHNCDWAYNWGIEPDNNPFDVDEANFEFVPMIWSATTSGISGQINRVLNLEQNFGVHVDYVLGFNEPELPTQSNMTVEQAINVWEIMTDQFADTDIKLVSPAVSGGGAIRVDDPNRPDGWLTEFMTEVETRNADTNPNNDLQVDAIAYHFYTVAFNPTVEADTLIDQIDDLWDRYQRPIWITEFAGTSFSLDNPTHSLEERTTFNRGFLEALIPMFDARPYVERVSWWQFGALGRRYSALSSLSNGVYTPTIIGDVYMRTTLDAGETYDFAAGETRPNYVHYLRGSHLTNTGPELTTALRAVDLIEGNSIMTGTSDFGFENANDAFVRVRSGATLEKQGDNTVSLPDLPIFNDGTISVEDGTLQLEGGVTLNGSGTLNVNQNGTLATSRGTVDENVELNASSVVMNQGVLHAKDGQTTLSGNLRLLTGSEIRTDGNLTIAGSTSGAGYILATGPGTLFLSGDGGHTSGAQVVEGNLIVANAATSATGPGIVLVDGTGSFGGFGVVEGDMLISDGSVAPGVSRILSPGISDIEFVEGAIVDALDFDFTGIQDDAPLSQTSTLAGGLRLVSGLDFGSGVQARNAANDGDEFNVRGFTNSTSYVTANSNGDYLTFTVAPVDGLSMIIEDVTVELRRNGSGAPQQYVIGTSIDGFNDAGRWGTLQLDIADTTTQVFTASNPGSVATSNEVEIRIAGFQATSGFGNTHFYDVSLDASFTSDSSGVPLDPTGILALGGNYTQLESATLKMELGGTQAGEFDQLQVAGNIILDGTLDVSLIDGFEPTAGQTFDIITANSVTGTFNNVIAPEGVNVQVNYTNSGVSLSLGAGLIGDFDEDGDVDVDDIDFYRLAIGLPGTGDFAQFDFNGDGLITAADMQIHIETYVQTSNGQTGTFLGDFNLDGTVNVLGDAFAMIGNLGNSVSSYADGDVNLDGIVNVLGDAFAMIGNLNRTNQP